MPRCALKRREPLVKFVRRAACGQLDAADDALQAAARGDKRARDRVARAQRELLRLRALLRLVRGPLGPDTFGREHGAVQRLLRRIAPHGPAGVTAATAKAAEIDTPAPVSTPVATPVLLRALADLAEIRVRAAHWHLPNAGFDALAPALRTAWRQAARPLGGARATPPAALAQAALTLHDQLRYLERVWPDALGAPRGLARTLATEATRLAERNPAPGDHVPVEPVKHADQARAAAVARVNAAAALLAAETPAAFTRRVSAYWDQWRRPGP